MGCYCRSCTKLVSFEEEEEVDVNLGEFEITNPTVTGTARIHSNCSECGQEMRDKTFDIVLDAQRVIDGHDCQELHLGRGWTAEVKNSERTERHQPPNKVRYVTFHGVKVDVEIACPCGEVAETITFTDECKASDMDDCQ